MTVLLDIDQLRTFIAIAETGSFTKAAEVVNKTQSAVSMQMKRLEERLERQIFARDGRASKLTDDGSRLLDYARRLVKLNVETVAAFSDAALSGRVRLGVPDDYADRYLPEIMARFSRAYPSVELTVLHRRQPHRPRHHHQLRFQAAGGDLPPRAPALGHLDAALDAHGAAAAARARTADLRLAHDRGGAAGIDRPSAPRAVFQLKRRRGRRRGVGRPRGVGAARVRATPRHARAVRRRWLPRPALLPHRAGAQRA